MKFSRRNCPIAKRRLTAVIGADPIWGAALKSGEAIAPLPHAGYGPDSDTEFQVLEDGEFIFFSTLVNTCYLQFTVTIVVCENEMQTSTLVRVYGIPGRSLFISFSLIA